MHPSRTFRIFADHYQFFVYDGDLNPFEPLPAYSEASIAQGWTRTGHAISFSTQAHLNEHRLDFFQERPPTDLKAERVTIHPLKLTSGALALHDTEEIVLAHLQPGDYAVVLAAYNLGSEQVAAEDELPDEEFFAHLEWERYELYVFQSPQPVKDGVCFQAG